ncbi:hypothetical protein [Hyphomonas johnsonii]|uniref:Lipoprotein n=1 Tax=Hyphomonas johnsonii MHS-2 TaxID=1280950 RepID=A0A059FHK3_9PROT|nr:hypothetical protein [Hyphomonas johnsonii]KCZ90072.1 hypothetical protein HJO_14021 [Hyphomonas johnsonii MHS-2]
MWIKRLGPKFAAAAITAGLTALPGLAGPASVDAACGLRDAANFRESLVSPTEEASPAYLLRTSEAFIDACPDRFEIRDAHLVAARAALDAGAARKAVAHYDAALAGGFPADPQTHLDHAVALLATGNSRRARDARDDAVAEWLAELDQRQAVRVTTVPVPDGMIYTVRYNAPDANLGITSLWLAVPKHDGLPAAILIRPAAKRAAWRALRMGGEPTDLVIAEQVNCRTSHMLTEVSARTIHAAIDEAARSALADYLGAPDGLHTTPDGEPLAACLGLDRMLHVPGRTRTAMLRGRN